MKNQKTSGTPMPTANLAINRSRLKVHNTSTEPTYYISKGTEFEIELFNPTKDVIMAKIFLNGKAIAQGGLVLKPAQRVFLERYIDVARKFKFDTYEVENTTEAKQAIEDNGDFKVEFYKERTVGVTQYKYDYTNNSQLNTRGIVSNYHSVTPISNNFSDRQNYESTSFNSIDFMSQELSVKSQPTLTRGRGLVPKLKKSKSIETGRVEGGSQSKQTIETVFMTWELLPFHTIEYKMLPLSQKINEVKDVKMKQYCVYCGMKNKTTFKFCPKCGERI